MNLLIHEAINDFRQANGIGKITWRNDLERGCFEHACYMANIRSCIHAPQQLLQNVHFECVGTEWKQTHRPMRDNIRSIIFNVLGGSQEHREYMLSASSIAGAYYANVDEYNMTSYICLRGYK